MSLMTCQFFFTTRFANLLTIQKNSADPNFFNMLKHDFLQLKKLDLEHVFQIVKYIARKLGKRLMGKKLGVS
jgi:hypothetical protein